MLCCYIVSSDSSYTKSIKQPSENTIRGLPKLHLEKTVKNKTEYTKSD